MRTADFSLRPTLAGLALLCGAAVLAAPRKTSALEFPEVDFREQSAPRFAALCIDPFTNRVVYVAFDGNVTDGYDKMWVWVPGERSYDPPKSVSASSEHRFRPLEFESTQDRKRGAVSWLLSWGIARTGGTYTRRDYVTGEVRTIQRNVTTYPYFNYVCNYERGEQGALRKAGNLELSISIPGRVPVSGVRTNLPGAHRPWNELYFGMGINPIHREKEESALIFRGTLTHRGGGKCSVRSLPEDAEISISVAPYLEEPLYDEKVTYAEAFGEGVKVDMPYGWYQFRWSFACEGLRISSRPPSRGWMYAFARPPPGSR